MFAFHTLPRVALTCWLLNSSPLVPLEPGEASDGVALDLYYDGRVVNPWSKGPNELLRLYFNDDEQGDSYNPVNPAENIEEGVALDANRRSMCHDSDDQSRDPPESWDDLDGEFEVEQNVKLGGYTFDLLHSNSGNKEVIVAAKFGNVEA